MDLLQLRGAMKRDPKAYEDELNLQLRHFQVSDTSEPKNRFILECSSNQCQANFFYLYRQASIQIFNARPSKPSEELSTITTFLTHVVPCYPKQLAEFPKQVVSLLEQHHLVMDPMLRKCMAECVIMMRNRNMLPAVGVNQLFFQMFRCKDKKLRATLSSHIVQDVKNMNASKQSNKTNKELQNFMFKMLQDRNAVAAKCSLDVLVSLYKKKVWEDAKTVNVIASACFAPEGKVRSTALNFFLGVDDEQVNCPTPFALTGALCFPRTDSHRCTPVSPQRRARASILRSGQRALGRVRDAARACAVWPRRFPRG